MATLDWIGKKAVVNHHREVPYHLLKEVPELSCGDADSGNLIVEGDNLVALKALLPYYAGKVKCIYIDPPYNTGNEGWVYNDNVNSPEMREWLGRAVGKEAEDLSRHDKWLCMMYPRLELLREFLSEDGAVFVSLDDNEIQGLRYLMDEIFGKRNFVNTIIWQKVYSPKNSARHFSEDHDYIAVYAKNAEVWRPNLVPRNAAQDSAYKNRDKDPRGPWKTSDLSARNPYSEGLYSVTSPSGRVIDGPPRGRYWTISEKRFHELNSDNRIWWGVKGDSIPQLKRFLHEVKQGVVPQTLWFYKDVGHTQDAKKELVATMDFPDTQSVFITPKPTKLIERILQVATNPGDLVLDSFAGSGSTGHAVEKMNASDSSKEGRKYVLIEIDSNLARTLTAERLRRVAVGHKNSKGEEIEPTGGAFQYVQLDEPLHAADGRINEAVKYPDLARHVFFIETGEPLPKDSPLNDPLLGVSNGKAVYLLYNGILKDKSVEGGNRLTRKVLESLPAHDGPKVVYGTACQLGPELLKRHDLTFKQIPYSIQTS
jgi:site-specific DNA-methyltransferase (adenine-specific)/adenine-specific DNA-methyltransferase